MRIVFAFVFFAVFADSFIAHRFPIEFQFAFSFFSFHDCDSFFDCVFRGCVETGPCEVMRDVCDSC